jgi:manganese/zinc/iron transport system ATP- binding protein
VQVDKVLCCKQLNVSYDTTPVLWDINLEVPPGKLVAIVGPNGAGKSTLLKAIVGIIPPFSGVIECLGSCFKKVRKKIAYVPQKEAVDWDFPITAFEVVLMGRYHQLGLFKWTRNADKEAARNALNVLGIEHLADAQIGELSGGQQQRVFIARALVQDPDLYILDEPFTGIDAATEAVLIAVFKKLQEKGKTLLIVHHDLQSVSQIFDWVILLNTRLIASGELSKVFTTENLYQTYGQKEEIFTEMIAQLKKKNSGMTL